MLKVLITEDDAMLRNLFSDYLDLVGYEVVGAASTIDEAVILAARHAPDVALVDYRLGNHELGTELKSRLPADCAAAILYLSGDPLHRVLTSQHGEGFIQKPVGLDELDQALRAVWAIKSQGSRSPEWPATSAVPKGFYVLGEPPRSAIQVA